MSTTECIYYRRQTFLLQSNIQRGQIQNTSTLGKITRLSRVQAMTWFWQGLLKPKDLLKERYAQVTLDEKMKPSSFCLSFEYSNLHFVMLCTLTFSFNIFFKTLKCLLIFLS